MQRVVLQRTSGASFPLTKMRRGLPLNWEAHAEADALAITLDDLDVVMRQVAVTVDEEAVSKALAAMISAQASLARIVERITRVAS
jgi:hypothetical protein